MRKDCTVCGDPFEGDPRKLYCSDRCKWQAKALRRGPRCSVCDVQMMGGTGSRRDGTAKCTPCRRADPVKRLVEWPKQLSCEHCGLTFAAKTSAHRFCSTSCYLAKKCDVCGEWFTSETLGGTQHYRTRCVPCTAMLRRRRWPSTKVKIVECVHCGGLTVVAGSRRRLCSESCKDARRAAAALLWAQSRPTRPLRTIECVECGSQVQTKHGRRFCGEPCSKKFARRQRKPTGLKLTTFAREKLYARDGYDCHLCGHPVADVEPPHPWTATLDHLVPRSLGGTDDPENLRTAHTWCNTVRGVAPVPTRLYPLPPLTWDSELFLTIRSAA